VIKFHLMLSSLYDNGTSAQTSSMVSIWPSAKRCMDENELILSAELLKFTMMGRLEVENGDLVGWAVHNIVVVHMKLLW